jgi:hypothetical protein
VLELRDEAIAKRARGARRMAGWAASAPTSAANLSRSPVIDSSSNGAWCMRAAIAVKLHVSQISTLVKSQNASNWLNQGRFFPQIR